MEASGINIEFLSINSKAYDVSELTLGLGQTIIMSAPSLDSSVQWFFNNDSVLTVTPDGNSATIKSDGVGTSIILIQDAAFAILKKIAISVISEEAVGLGLKAGSAELK